MSDEPEARVDVASNWSMSDERALHITVLHQRINFFFVFFSLVIAGALNCRSQSHLIIILWLGTFLCGVLAFSVFRIQYKTELIRKELESNLTHPVTQLAATARPIVIGFRWMFGYLVPSICSGLLLLGSVLASFDLLSVAPIAQATNSPVANMPVENQPATRGNDTSVPKYLVPWVLVIGVVFAGIYLAYAYRQPILPNSFIKGLSLILVSISALVIVLTGWDGGNEKALAPVCTLLGVMLGYVFSGGKSSDTT